MEQETASDLPQRRPPARAAAKAARDVIRSRIASGLEATEASEEQLSEGVCAICLEPLFVAAKKGAGSPRGTKKKSRYRQNLCKRVVELVSCSHAFHNTCLMRAARDAPGTTALNEDDGPSSSRGRAWCCPLCRQAQKSLDDLDHFDGWRMLTAPVD